MNVLRLNDLLRVTSLCKYCYNGLTSQRLADFPINFQPKDVQRGWYDVWEKNEYFTSKDDKKEALKMILPPPNITGILHLGHALTVTVQDALARWYRMKGHPVMWVPGFDHAGIATQVMVEKYLFTTRGIVRKNMDNEQFLSFIWQWKDQKENIIRSQLKALGATLNWSKEYFTMSEEHNAAVIEALMVLNERNMLYRKKKMINWSPTLGSTISEIEVEHQYLTGRTKLEIPGYNTKVTFGEIIKVAYPIENSKDEIIVATTRPETMFGDVAIAVHPDDERHVNYIGRRVWHDLRKTFIPVIADISVDKEFGTGAVKITPAHDELDYAIAKKHDLDIIDVIDECGNITKAGNEYEGLPRFIARKKVLDVLSNKSLIRGIADHKMSVPQCSRSKDIVEHLLKEQWFIKCESMAHQAVEAVRDGRLKITPNVHEHTWYNWLENIRDWCISRQLSWGHRFPAYGVKVGDNMEWIVARCENDARLIGQKKYGSNVELHPCNDVLDTWFSSAILPFAVMGWPNKTDDFKKFYPLTLMETGYDILFFWVARMVMLGLELTNKLPFEEVLLHGILCDGYGKKMSKTLGNVISPENIISGITLEDLIKQTKENCAMGIVSKKDLNRIITANRKMFPNGISECGVDALRMTLCSRNIKNQTINFDQMECRTNNLFANKIWQVSKYVLLSTDGKPCDDPKTLTSMDRWILSKLSLMINTVDESFVQRDFHKVVAAIKQFLYYEYCDYYVEGTKWGFKSENTDVIQSHTYTLIKCLEVSLRILAPIAPYLADDLYQRLSKKLPGFLSLTSLLEAQYPQPEEYGKWRDIGLDERMNEVLRLVTEIRILLSNISLKSNPEVHITTTNSSDYNIYEENKNLIMGGSKVWNIFIHQSDYTENENAIRHCFSPDCTLIVVAQDANVLAKIKTNIEKKNSNKSVEEKVISQVSL